MNFIDGDLSFNFFKISKSLASVSQLIFWIWCVCRTDEVLSLYEAKL